MNTQRKEAKANLDFLNECITVEQLAQRWRTTKTRLYQWVSRGLGVRYHKNGGTIMYYLKDVEDYERKFWTVSPQKMKR